MNILATRESKAKLTVVSTKQPAFLMMAIFGCLECFGLMQCQGHRGVGKLKPCVLTGESEQEDAGLVHFVC